MVRVRIPSRSTVISSLVDGDGATIQRRGLDSTAAPGIAGPDGRVGDEFSAAISWSDQGLWFSLAFYGTASRY